MLPNFLFNAQHHLSWASNLLIAKIFYNKITGYTYIMYQEAPIDSV